MRNIDTVACAARNVKVLALRRRFNIGCAEHALAMMLTLAKKLRRIAGLISVEQLTIDNVLLTPHVAGGPRLNGLHDIEDLIIQLSRALAS